MTSITVNFSLNITDKSFLGSDWFYFWISLEIYFTYLTFRMQLYLLLNMEIEYEDWRWGCWYIYLIKGGIIYSSSYLHHLSPFIIKFIINGGMIRLRDQRWHNIFIIKFIIIYHHIYDQMWHDIFTWSKVA